MKKLRFILLSAALAAVFGFSFIGCSNYSSNGSSSNHGMTIKLKASGTTYTYYADYAADDNYARAVNYKKMIVFNSDGTEITNNSVSIEHDRTGVYTLSFDDGTGRKVYFKTKDSYDFYSEVNSNYSSQKIVELTINGKQYSLPEPQNL